MTSTGVHLREITDDNRDAVRALRLRRRQKQFVASVTKSLKEAAKTPEANPWYRAVYRGEEPVGFVMLSWNPPAGHGISDDWATRTADTEVISTRSAG